MLRGVALTYVAGWSNAFGPVDAHGLLLREAKRPIGLIGLWCEVAGREAVAAGGAGGVAAAGGGVGG